MADRMLLAALLRERYGPDAVLKEDDMSITDSPDIPTPLTVEKVTDWQQRASAYFNGEIGKEWRRAAYLLAVAGTPWLFAELARVTADRDEVRELAARRESELIYLRQVLDAANETTAAAQRIVEAGLATPTAAPKATVTLPALPSCTRDCPGVMCDHPEACPLGVGSGETTDGEVAR